MRKQPVLMGLIAITLILTSCVVKAPVSENPGGKPDLTNGSHSVTEVEKQNTVPNGIATVTISGVITANGFQIAQTGKGLPNAQVGIARTPFKTKTDADGHFTLKDVPADQAKSLIAQRTDSNGKRYNIREHLPTPTSGTINLQSLLLQQAGSIYGLVKTDGEKHGIDVFIDGTTMGAKTDVDGSYAIANVPVGTHKVTAAIPGYKSVSDTVKVDSGKPSELQLELKDKIANATFGTVEGNVVSGSGPIAGVQVLITGQSYTSFTDKEGKYRLANVEPKASYTLLIKREGFKDQELTIAVKAGETLTQDITLTAAADEPPGTIQGTLNDNEGKPLANAEVETEPTTQKVKTDAQGHFEIPDALPGSYYVKGKQDGKIKGNGFFGLDPGQIITTIVQGTIIAGGNVNVCNNINNNGVNINAPGSQINVNIDSNSECNINN